MGKYTNDAKQLLLLVGGKENIAAVSHCMTRMRFVLNDPAKSDTGKIEALDSVQGTFTQSGQFQVIIGNNVGAFYNEFIEISGIDGVSKDATKSVATKNMNWFQKMLAFLAEVFSPLIPAIIVGGLLLGLRNVLGEVAFLEGGTKTITDLYPFWSGVNSFLWLICEAIFHFLPVGITWSISKKMGTTQILGIVLGLTLVSPQLLNAYSFASTAAADIPFWDFGFFQIQMVGYQAQVLPAMFAGILLCYLERGLRKIIPNAVSMIVVPLLSLVPTVLIAHTILGPLGWQLGDWIAQGVYWGLSSPFNWVFAALFGFFYAPLVITGLHHMTNAIDLQLMDQYDGTILWPMIALSNMAQASAVMGVILLHRGNEKEEQVSIPAAISAYLGVTEPAIFGINLKYFYPFLAGMIGSSIAAVISVSSGTMAYAIGVGGLPGILSIKTQFIPIFGLAMLVSIVVPFFLTILFRKMNWFNKIDNAPIGKKAFLAKAAELEAQSNEEIFISPLNGRIIPLSEVQDSAFASGNMGTGIAIIPSEGKLYAPASGIISAFFPTKHAIGITTDQGTDILIHIGMDTVNLDGEHFTKHIEQGDHVVQGQLLLEFDIQAIEAAGFVLETPIIILMPNPEWLIDNNLPNGSVTVGERILTIEKVSEPVNVPMTEEQVKA